MLVILQVTHAPSDHRAPILLLQMNAYLSLLEDKNVVMDEEAVHDWVIGPLNDI